MQVKKLISGNDVYCCDECILLMAQIIQDKPKESYQKNGLTPPVIKDYLDERMIGQDLAKKTMCVAIYNHLKRIKNPIIEGVEIDKSNVLFIGPTGCGKCLDGSTKIIIDVDLELFNLIKSLQD